MVDTGSTTSGIRESVAKRLALPRQRAVGEDGRALKFALDPLRKAETVTVDSFRIGPEFLVNDVPLTLLSDQEMDRLFGRSVDGFAGMNILWHFATVFDFADHKIGFVFPPRLEKEDLGTLGMNGAVALPLRGSKYQPNLDVTINDRFADSFLIDTGSSTSGLSTELAKSIAPKHTGAAQTYQQQGGSVEMAVWDAQTIRVGSIELKSVPLTIPVRGRTAGLPSRIGLDILKRFRLVIDPAGGKVYLSARSAR